MNFIDLGRQYEVIKEKVGFRRFEMKDNMMHINGKRIVFKGVNRHEFSSATGRVLSEEDILKDIITIKKNNINALFVITPYTVKEDEQKKINYMSDIVESYGYNFLDMNRYIDEMNLDFSRDIKDYGTHTNVAGADKVSTFLEQYLIENYRDKGTALTEDHRSDRKYKSWDKAYEKWKKDYEAGLETIAYNLDNGIYYEIVGEDD